jgi:hypothetical protein
MNLSVKNAIRSKQSLVNGVTNKMNKMNKMTLSSSIVKGVTI